MPDRSDIPKATREQLSNAGEARWREFRRRCGRSFHAFVPGDYEGAYEVLRRLRPHSDSFLELGSGVGVITILAALLGYDAAGIEIDPWLVDTAEELAMQLQAQATFVEGSFIPAPFQEAVDRSTAELPSVLDGEPAYAELGRDLDDFDLVYAFYWPGLEDLFFDLMRIHGRPHAVFLTFGGTDGYQVWRDGKPWDPATMG